MSLIPAVKRQIKTRAATDPTRITLEYLLANGVGRNNAVPVTAIIFHLQDNGVKMTAKTFQQTILADSRKDGSYFIGSSRQGYYLIAHPVDYQEMATFYRKRIAAEQHHLNTLQTQATRNRVYLIA